MYHQIFNFFLLSKLLFFCEELELWKHIDLFSIFIFWEFKTFIDF